MVIPIIGLSIPLVSIFTSLFLLRGGCLIVDSTRKGKRCPDSMSKTIPIWTCVLNRAVSNYRKRLNGAATSDKELDASDTEADRYWDCSLHLPLWVSETEKALIEEKMDSWVTDLEESGADIASLASSLRKPLQPLWISPKTVIWLNEVPEYDSWDFTPIILVSASSSDGNYLQRTMSEFSWNYIPGAGDDEESWAGGLSPSLFWKHVYDLVGSGPDSCNQNVAEIVEKDRVFRSQRGENAPQVTARFQRMTVNGYKFPVEELYHSPQPCLAGSEKTSSSSSCGANGIFWLDLTNVAVGSTRFGSYNADMEVTCVDSVLNCDKEPLSPCPKEGEAYLHLPIANSKMDRFSLLRNLPCALDFAKTNLKQGKRLLICCKDGEDISICVCLAILVSLFDDRGNFDEGEFFREMCVTKSELRRRLVYICKFAVHARPSRGNLKQVFSFLNGGSAVGFSS